MTKLFLLKVLCRHWIGPAGVICGGSAELIGLQRGFVCTASVLTFFRLIRHARGHVLMWAQVKDLVLRSWTVIPAKLELTSSDDNMWRLVNSKAELWVEFDVSLLSSN